MQLYRSLPDDVHQTHRRIEIFTAAAGRADGVTIEQVAAQEGCSPRLIYKLQRVVELALVPGKPGPKPRRTSEPEVAVVAQALVPTPIDPRVLTLTLAVEHVSVRGMQRIFVASGWPPPARDTLLDQLHTAGRAARRLLERAKRQLRSKLRCLAADDIFFHRVPVKVVMEPVSGAVLEVWRWSGSHTGEDWELFLREWPQLRLLVSDQGSDLLRAVRLLVGVDHQADLFHDRQWWNDELFGPLSRRERRLAEAVTELLDAATTPRRRGRSVSAATIEEAEALRAEAEEDFFDAVRAEDALRALFRSLDPRGRLWTAEAAEDVLDHDVAPWLAKLPETIGVRALTHVYTYRTSWCSHRVLWDLIEVHLAPGSTGSRAQVIDAMLALLATQEAHARATTWETARACQQREAALRAELSAACRNVEAVEREVRSLRDNPRRSSSMVEAFNAVLRGAQQVHRRVCDDLLALYALRWNLTPRTEGKRRGASPFARLGVDFADDERSWEEMLIEEMDRA